MGVTVCKDDLMRMGYKKYQAIMVQRDCPYYNNKRLGRVSRESCWENIRSFFWNRKEWY